MFTVRPTFLSLVSALLIVFVSSFCVLANEPESLPNADAAELELWQVLSANNDLEAYQTYLDFYPDGAFAAEALKRIEELESTRANDGDVGPANPTDRAQEAIGERDGGRRRGVIETAARPPSLASGPAPFHVCDQLAADPDDQNAMGVGTEDEAIDVQAAISACEEAVALHPDEPRFQYQLGRGLYQSERWIEAEQWHRRAAEAGYLPALHTIAYHFYYDCRKIDGADLGQAIDAFWFAAEDGHMPATYHLASLYRDGETLEKDPVQAAELYRKTAEAGDRLAMYQLARAYERSEGLVEDKDRASVWYERAAAQFRLAAFSGTASAAGFLSSMYEFGWGVPKSDQQAARFGWLEAELLKQAVERGNIWALRSLALHYRWGDGKNDPQHSAEWSRRAAEAGLTYSMDQLAELYENGEGVSKNIGEAERWRRRAVEALKRLAADGDIYSMTSLAEKYRDGTGTEKNERLADEMASRAAEKCRAGLGVEFGD